MNYRSGKIESAFQEAVARLKPRPARSGIVLITAIILIAAMMMIGTALMLAANMDLRHAGVDRKAHDTFFGADGMINISVGLLKNVLSGSSAGGSLDNTGPVRVVVRDNDLDLNDKDRVNDPDKAALAFYSHDGTILGWADVISYDQTWGSHTAGTTDGGAAYKNLRVYVIRALSVSSAGGPEVSRIVAFYQSYE